MHEVTFFQQSNANPHLYLLGDFGGNLKFLDMRNPYKFVLESKNPLSGGVWRISSQLQGEKEYFALALCSGDEIVVLDQECKQKN